MVSLTIPVSDGLKAELKHFSWVNWSDVTREEMQQETLHKLLTQLHSKEEQELTEWAVRMGRTVNEEAWKKLLSTLSPQEKKALLE